MKTIERTCRCGNKFKARVADIKRGWAKSCSKSCAALRREKTLYRSCFRKGESRSEDNDYETGGWDAHKSVF